MFNPLFLALFNSFLTLPFHPLFYVLTTHRCTTTGPSHSTRPHSTSTPAARQSQSGASQKVYTG